jgi:hypothetical protein
MTLPTPKPLTDAQRAESALTKLEALADVWAAEINLTAWIDNIVSPMRINKDAPQDVRDHFISRMADQIYAVMSQAFIEGSYRTHMGAEDTITSLTSDLQRTRDALQQLADAKWTDDLTREIALTAITPPPGT